MKLYGKTFLCGVAGLLALGLLFPCAAAACTGPAGISGDFIYNLDYHVPQYCDGTNWNAIGKLQAQYSVTGSSCSSPAGTEGDFVYNSTDHVPQYCDGGKWRAMGKWSGLTGSGCSNPVGTEGRFIYNSNFAVPQYCDGKNWIAMSSTATVIVLPFSFTNVYGVADGTTYNSNSVRLAGNFTNLTATCGSGCTGISINGGGFTAGPVTGVNSGDFIAIQQVSSSNPGTSTFAVVRVGSTTSVEWEIVTFS